MEEGLRVLAVADDKTFLLILEKMLRSCKYEVTIRRQGEQALSILLEDKNRFDIILCDVHMPDVDGFKLLEVIGSKTDIPVVLISSDDSSEAVTKGVINGACDFLIKPINIEQIRVIWQHVLRRRQNGLKGNKLGQNGPINREMLTNQSNHADNTSTVSGPSTENLMRINGMEKHEEDEEEEGEASPEYGTKAKKPRIIWTTELHEKFFLAVKQLGIDKAVPKKILECMQLMGVTNLTRENVASHLQKFRLYVRRRSMDSLEQCGNSSSFAGLNGFDQASSSGHQFGSAQYQYGNGIAMPLHEQRKLLDPMMLLHASQVHHVHGGVSPNLGFGSRQELPLLGQPVLNFPNGGNNSLFEPVNNYGHANVVVPHHMELGNMIDHDHHQENNYSMDDQGMNMTEQSFVPDGNLYAQLMKHKGFGAGGVLPEQGSDHEAHLYSY